MVFLKTCMQCIKTSEPRGSLLSALHVFSTVSTRWSLGSIVLEMSLGTPLWLSYKRPSGKRVVAGGRCGTFARETRMVRWKDLNSARGGVHLHWWLAGESRVK